MNSALAVPILAAMLLASCAQAPQQSSPTVNGLGKPATVSCEEACVVVPVPVWLEILKRLHASQA